MLVEVELKRKGGCGLLSTTMHMRAVLVFLLIVSYWAPASAVAKTKESWFRDSPLSVEAVTDLNSHLRDQTLVIQLADPTSYELEPLAHLKSGGTRSLVIGRWPSEDLLPALTRLTRLGWRLTVLEGTYPTEWDLDRMNILLPRSLQFAVTAYAGPEIFALLGRLDSKIQVTVAFATLGFPRFMDRDALRAAPLSVRFRFIQNYWPGYIHMDVLNMLPQEKDLWIRDLLPDAEALGYLRGIERLSWLRFNTQSPAGTTEIWNQLPGISVEWQNQGPIPTAEECQSFARSAPTNRRKLTLDTDFELSPTERRLLDSLDIDVLLLRTLQ